MPVNHLDGWTQILSIHINGWTRELLNESVRPFTALTNTYLNTEDRIERGRLCLNMSMWFSRSAQRVWGYKFKTDRMLWKGDRGGEGGRAKKWQLECSERKKNVAYFCLASCLQNMRDAGNSSKTLECRFPGGNKSHRKYDILYLFRMPLIILLSPWGLIYCWSSMSDINIAIVLLQCLPKLLGHSWKCKVH
jgi:hypothetical protein